MREYLRRSGNRSLIVVPLRAHEKIIGTLLLLDRMGRTYSDREVGLLQTFADQGALALENARLFEDAKRKMDELQQNSSELEKANKSKDEFLSVMSHELRTQLNVVLGYCAMLKEGMLGEINPKQEQALGKVLARTNDQLRMINSILQASQIRAGSVSVAREELDLSQFMDEIRSDYRFVLEKKKDIALQWAYGSDLPVVRTDGDKLRHILQNLVTNAIKFTEKGCIIVSVEYFAETKVLEFKVTDSGIGIPESMSVNIFEMFRQADSSESRQYDGVGSVCISPKSLLNFWGGVLARE